MSQRLAEVVQASAQIVDLVEQRQHDRQRLLVDLQLVAQFADQPDPGDVDVLERILPGLAVRLDPLLGDPGGLHKRTAAWQREQARQAACHRLRQNLTHCRWEKCSDAP